MTTPERVATLEEIPREDRRRIRALLADNWDGANYVRGHSDLSLSKTLEVQVCWVRLIREEFFGDLPDNAEACRQLKGFQSRVERIVRRMNTLIADVDRIQQQSKALTTDVRTILTEIEQLKTQFNV